MKPEVITKTPVKIEIYNEDCLKVLPRLPDNSIDLIITSPPYNINIKYDTWKDNLEWNEYYIWCQKWLTELYRILKKDGRLCLNYPFVANNINYKDLQCLIGIEISKNYYNIGKERLLFELQQGKLFNIKSIYELAEI